MAEPRPFFNCHGIRVGYIVTNEHGGSFFVQSVKGDPGKTRNMGLNSAYMREAFRNMDTSALRKSFA